MSLGEGSRHRFTFSIVVWALSINSLSSLGPDPLMSFLCNIFLWGLLAGVCAGDEKGRLLKVPRIYNALITTDEELLPSQAYPAVSPVLHPTSHIFVQHKNIGASPLAPLSETTFHEPVLPPLSSPPPLIPVQPPVLDESPNVKNHRPADPAIPDVPPPPLPVSFKD
ncbi:uncharacterized protein [Rhodnius prolixus]|uniref:uncharacterized protein n=1 Tax=Rhodnius prolixus TaxID=13249 RepID=UPI003D189919